MGTEQPRKVMCCHLTVHVRFLQGFWAEKTQQTMYAEQVIEM